MRPLLFVAGLLLAGCAGTLSASPTATTHAAHDPQLERFKAALGDAFGMTFAPAGPHHEIGRAPDAIELDLVGVPVEEGVLSVPRIEPELAIAYLPHLRDLLHGPAPLWRWIEEGLTCRRDTSVCEPVMSQGNLMARFTEGDPAYVVLVIARR